MRLVYYGTPSLAVPPLTRLAEKGRAPALVVTRPDRPRGRGLAVHPSPVRVAAESLGIPVATPRRASAPEEVERIRSLGPDLIVLAAYGQILSPELLQVPRIGAINLHYSLLPRHRGASPIQAAILSGDPETGVTTMWMTPGLDEGPIFLACSTPIGPGENAGSLGARLAELGARCLSETLDRIERGELSRHEQDGSCATYAAKLGPADARLSLDDDPLTFARKVRALAPEPGAYLETERERLKVFEASPGEGVGSPRTAAAGPGAPGTVLAVDRDLGLKVQLTGGSVWIRSVRPGGRKQMSGHDYAIGRRLKPGMRLKVKESGP